MKANAKLGFSLSIGVLIGFPVLFLIVSVLTGEWTFFFLSLIPSLSAGLTGLLVSRNEMKKEDRAK